MALNSTPVTRCLDQKFRILGFEVLDLLAIFLLLSVLHLLFGDLGSQVIMIWLPSSAFALVLWIGKRNKPDNYILHWIKFYIKPGVINAFDESKTSNPFPKLTKEGHVNE
jgi:hypothetical protein